MGGVRPLNQKKSSKAKKSKNMYHKGPGKGGNWILVVQPLKKNTFFVCLPFHDIKNVNLHTFTTCIQEEI